MLPLQVALQLPHLRLSPLGVVPQQDRRPSLIVDYTYSGVNNETVRMAPPEAMHFGKALQRILRHVVHAHPRYRPAWLAKIDIADGFYRIGLQPVHVPRLGVILPTSGGEPLVALPLALPMGWVESPPYFTAATETACNLLSATLRSGTAQLPQHHLKGLAATPVPTDSPTSGEWAPRLADPCSTMPCPSSLVAYADVYVDDFVLTAQTQRNRDRVLRSALQHSIDPFLRPLIDGNCSSRKEPVSVKKLCKGDACWATRKKTILGWEFDTVAGTMRLPPHRVARLRTT